ncbi:MAG: lytic transglycosylase F [Deltaproteobacteria bacterium]|nr:lytic transglycosylase F [Deltaproteobacteria bacterium]
MTTAEPRLAEFTNDLDEMMARRTIWVLVTYNRTNFFLVQGRLLGYEYELLDAFEKFLNQGVSRRELKTTLLYIPVKPPDLIPMLVSGRGDLAAAGLTVTKDRQEQVDFTEPYLTGFSEIVVSHKKAPPVMGLDDLAGRKVYVKRGSRYADHLKQLNRKLFRDGKAAIEIVEMGHSLDTEDILEFVNAGIADLTVVDEYLAQLWSAVYENLVLQSDVQLRRNLNLAWAVRKNNPRLLDKLNGFIKLNRKGTLMGNILFKRYFEDTRWIRNPLTPEGLDSLKPLVEFFRKYGEEYDIRPNAQAALAFQESGLKTDLKSRTGAVGLMQIKPLTAAEQGVRGDLFDPDNNVKAAARYLDFLRRRYFNDPGIETSDRIDFLLASYNAGPRKIIRMRQKAAEMGLHPNIWVDNVERSTLRYIGTEPAQYVPNVRKYFIAFELGSEGLLNRKAIRKALNE